ncbi:hypothetical protein A2U01_0100334, partial [Trifolium medium]|nr:hypothetical protein [Trifolium medium]
YLYEAATYLHQLNDGMPPTKFSPPPPKSSWTTALSTSVSLPARE